MNIMADTISARFITLVLLLTFLASCTAKGMTRGTPSERRQAIQEMRQKVLTQLYSVKPDTRAQIASDPFFMPTRQTQIIETTHEKVNVVMKSLA